LKENLRENKSKNKVRAMFDSIARNYDFLNHFLSMGIDRYWRRKLIFELKKYQPEKIVDIAAGTADLSILAAKKGIRNITGVDLSSEMIRVGNEKIEKLNLQSLITLKEGDAENLSFNDNSFDAATIAYGVRNFENLEKGLKEISRILKQGKPLLILEFSKPDNFIIRWLYNLYSKFFIPAVGKLISGNSNAYKYLPESIKEFPSGNDFLLILKNCGYSSVRMYKLTFGISTLYIGEKNIEIQ
jgi:demethylmenaquinone methyltransferase/2-methoxy-6-polyprenyl-1,4-benzoquinol methylase